MKFWIAYNPNRALPTVMHTSVDAARIAAQRLAKNLNDTFMVMEFVEECSPARHSDEAQHKQWRPVVAELIAALEVGDSLRTADAIIGAEDLLKA